MFREPSLFALACMVLFTATCNAAALTPADLRCEYRTNPLGIGQTQPRFDWKLNATDPAAHDLKQSAYQIVVASSIAKLDQPDLWDSGKVAADATNQIVYSGKALSSEQLAFWRVRVWDQAGVASNWSEPAHFSIGLSNWTAKWIGYDEKTPEQIAAEAETNNETLTFEGLSWMGSTGNSTTRYFRKTVTLDPGEISRGHCVITADSRFELYVNGQQVGAGTDWHKPQSLQYMSLLKPGDNALVIAVHHDGDGPGAVLGRFRIKVGAAPSMIIDIDSSWDVTSAPNANDSQPATTIARYGDAPWGRPPVRALVLPPPPYLRKQFAISKPIARATVYATALGVYELHLNGQRVGQDHLTPGWTEYDKRVYYQTYDVTPLVRQGDNTIGAILGDGWYAGYWSMDGKRGLWGNEPRVMAQLNIEFTDGSRQTIATDESWKANYGPLREADMLMGCTYNAAVELVGWDTTKFDDLGWKPVAVTDHVKPLVQAAPANPVQTCEELPARSVTEAGPGTYRFDLGQNMVGWTRLKLAGAKPGQKIMLRHSEMMNPDGTLYTASLRAARAIDTYISRGGEVNWEPKFTFHGFRYVEVSGLDAKPPLDAITGIVVHSQMQQTGSFECSNPLVNKLVSNIIWGQKGNYLDIPTDCPQRDERLGWTGDAQFFIPTAAYNFDISGFFTKWLVDLEEDSVDEDGAFASTAPDMYKDKTRDGATAWADAGIICPYTIYKVYGDTHIIRQHYAAMSKYIDYLQKTSTNLVRTQGTYGDWVNLGGGAKSEVIGTAYFEHVTRLMSEMAAAVGRTDDATKYKDLADRIRATFIKEFVTPDGKIKESSQTGYALAFAFDLIPSELRQKSSDAFVEEIRAKDWHLATGFIGTPILLPALSKAGRDDVAYRLLMTDTFPSWLYQVKLGATTMWERWDGYTPEKGFFNPGMNSFNHYAFGSVGAWLYRTVGGIDTESAGYNQIIIRPSPGGDLSYAKATYDSIHGLISSQWKIENGKITLDVTIPPNTTATIYVPGKTGNDAAIHKVGSGKYTFTAPW